MARREATGGGRRSRRRMEESGLDRFPTGESRFVSALFDDLGNAWRAVEGLEARGYPRSELSVLMSDETRLHSLRTHVEHDRSGSDAYVVDEVELERDNKALKGAGAGSAIGGAVGAVAAALGGVATLVTIPPLGLVVAGPLAAAFAGAGAGGAVGGLVGALTGAGMSEYRAKRLEKVLREGNIVVGGLARTPPELRDIGETLEANGGTLVGAKA